MELAQRRARLGIKVSRSIVLCYDMFMFIFTVYHGESHYLCFMFRCVYILYHGESQYFMSCCECVYIVHDLESHYNSLCL